jgi:hypothetical protein
MRITLLLTLTFHLLSGVFWAGSTFAMARTAAAAADRLFWPQMGAAAVAIMTGGYLWHLLHTSFGIQEQVLALGAPGAILAAATQATLCGPALRQLKRADDKGRHLQARLAFGHRVAAALLALTVICMAVARYI